MYQLFVERMAVHTKYHKQELTSQEIEEQEKLEILLHKTLLFHFCV